MGKFLSTLPARGATPDFQAAKAVMNIFLSTLPARGATEGSVNSMKAAWISIHAPREGSDYGKPAYRPAEKEFLSTLPARGATERMCNA